MTKEKFWEEAGKLCPEIIGTAADLLKDTCLLFTDLLYDITWVPDKTAEYFGIRENLRPDFYHFFLEKVHPYDRPEYLEAIEKKCSGMKPKTLQTILGHSNIGITMNLYVHTTEDEKHKEIEMIASSLKVV